LELFDADDEFGIAAAGWEVGFVVNGREGSWEVNSVFKEGGHGQTLHNNPILL
jgi:hypothetical protein